MKKYSLMNTNGLSLGELHFVRAMARLESFFIPEQSDWHEAEENRKRLESFGYKLDVSYPFDCGGGYHDVYEKYLISLGLE